SHEPARWAPVVQRLRDAPAVRHDGRGDRPQRRIEDGVAFRRPLREMPTHPGVVLRTTDIGRAPSARPMRLAVLADVHANLPALRWTRIQLTPGSVGYLKDLEDRTRTTMPEGVVAMYHGSPRDDDEYVFPYTADDSLVRKAGAPFVILGHTHLPMARSFRSGLSVNPGSVGQPRDGDPRAAWGLLDLSTRTFGLRRVPYDIDAVATAIRRTGLPTELADRLYAGV